MPLSPTLHWTEAGLDCSALWRSERGAAPPKKVVLADDTTTADDAYHLACEGTALLWRGDFQNARQLLQALARRIDKTPQRKQRAAKGAAIHKPPVSPADSFNLHRQAQAQRARVLAMVLLPFNADYSPAPDRYVRHCKWLLDQDVGLAVFGTNSEANSLLLLKNAACWCPLRNCPSARKRIHSQNPLRRAVTKSCFCRLSPRLGVNQP